MSRCRRPAHHHRRRRPTLVSPADRDLRSRAGRFGRVRMDPENGFPIGTPEGPAAAISWHGIAHIVAATVAFTGLAAACIVLTVRMVRRRAGWAAVLNACAALVFLAPGNPAWASIQVAVNGLVAFIWTTAVALWLLRSSSAR